MASKEFIADTSPHDSGHDSEKNRPIHTPGDGVVPENLREKDFLTRNGLNLSSFKRRTFFQ